MRNLLIGSAFLSAAASIWGATFVAVRLAVFAVPPLPLVWLRYLTTIFALFIVAKYMGVSFYIEPKDRKILLLSALVGQVASIVTQETGTMLTSAQIGSVITASTPAFMVVFGYFLLHERLSIGRVMSVVLATAGVLFIVVDPDNTELNSALGGSMLVIAAVTWALMSVLLKFLAKYSVVTLTFYGVLVALIALAPYSMYWLMTAADWNAIMEPTVFGAIIYLGVISTAAGFCLWNKGLIYMDAALAGFFLFFQPVVGTILGYYVLDEPITKYFLLGFALIAVGVILAMRGGNTTAEEKLKRAREAEI